MRAICLSSSGASDTSNVSSTWLAYRLAVEAGEAAAEGRPSLWERLFEECKAHGCASLDEPLSFSALDQLYVSRHWCSWGACVMLKAI